MSLPETKCSQGCPCLKGFLEEAHMDIYDIIPGIGTVKNLGLLILKFGVWLAENLTGKNFKSDFVMQAKKRNPLISIALLIPVIGPIIGGDIGTCIYHVPSEEMRERMRTQGIRFLK